MSKLKFDPAKAGEDRSVFTHYNLKDNLLWEAPEPDKDKLRSMLGEEYLKQYQGVFNANTVPETSSTLTFDDIARMQVEMCIFGWGDKLYPKRKWPSSKEAEYLLVKDFISTKLKEDPPYLRRHLPKLLGGGGEPTENPTIRLIYARILKNKIME